MDPLPFEPRSLKDLTEADLRRGARLIIKVQDELDPQLRMATPEGDYHIALTLPAEEYGRKLALRALGTFMIWRQVMGFTFCSELIEPDCVYCMGVGPDETVACLSRIRRRPAPWTKENFGPVEWLGKRWIADEVVALLPKGGEVLTPTTVSACNTWFGKDGKFPAVHVPSGEVRGV